MQIGLPCLISSGLDSKPDGFPWLTTSFSDLSSFSLGEICEYPILLCIIQNHLIERSSIMFIKTFCYVILRSIQRSLAWDVNVVEVCYPADKRGRGKAEVHSQVALPLGLRARRWWWWNWMLRGHLGGSGLAVVDRMVLWFLWWPCWDW